MNWKEPAQRCWDWVRKTTPLVLARLGQLLQSAIGMGKSVLLFLLRCLIGVPSFLRGAVLRLWGWLTRAMPWLGKAFQNVYRYLSPRVQSVASRIWRRVRITTGWLWRTLLSLVGLILRVVITVLLYAGPIVLGFWSFGRVLPGRAE